MGKSFAEGRKPKTESFWDCVPRYPHPYGCWQWSGSVNGEGYGQWGKYCRLAHRLVYEAARGPIAEGMVLDHLCHNRLCVNPYHLEPVTMNENTRRKRRNRAAA